MIVFTGQLSIDGSTHELIVKVDPQLGHVAPVIADDHVLADIRCQSSVEIAEPLEVNAVWK